MRTFRVTYETKGVRVIDVTTKQKIPENWDSLKTQEQDEWLYENQDYAVIKSNDNHHGNAVAIVELRSNLRVVP